MIKVLLLISLLTFTLGSELSSQQTTYSAVTVGNNEIRALQIVDNRATDNSVAVGGLKVEISSQSSNSATAELNAGGFKFAGGQSLTKEPQLGFAALSATATASWSATGSGNLYVNVQGAWAEVVFGFSSIFLYQERNNNPGFQYNLGDPVFDCTDSSTQFDCIYPLSDVKLDKDLTYATLTTSQTTCAAANLQGYSPNCTIWQITSVGSLGGAKVLEVTLTLASQKVIMGPTVIGGKSHQLGPDYGKVDFTITYPWTAKGKDTIKLNATVAIAVYAAGKAGTSTVTAGTLDGKSALLWVTENNKAAVWSWDGEAYVTSSNGVDQSSTAYIVGLSGDAIGAWKAPAICIDVNCIANKIIIGIWQIVVAVVKGLGWTPQILIISWNVPGADKVYYDPGIGMTDTASSGMFLAPTLIYFVWVLVHYFFRN
jgi:hypothetical protein